MPAKIWNIETFLKIYMQCKPSAMFNTLKQGHGPTWGLFKRLKHIETLHHRIHRQASRRIRRCWLLSPRAHQRRRKCHTGISVCACKGAMQFPGQRSWQVVHWSIRLRGFPSLSQEISRNWACLCLSHAFTTNFSGPFPTHCEIIVKLQLELSIEDAGTVGVIFDRESALKMWSTMKNAVSLAFTKKCLRLLQLHTNS